MPSIDTELFMLNNETVYYIDLRRVVDEFLCLYFLWFESQSYF